jgi:uncharacterized membrane protein
MNSLHGKGSVASIPNPVTPGRAVEFFETDNGQRLAIVLFSLVATVVIVAFPGSAGAVVLGMPYLFFIPGFAVVRLFFWKGTSQAAKLVLSLGLSVLVLIFLALALVFTVGLYPDTARASMVLFTLVAVAIDVFWRRPLTKDQAAKTADEKLPKTVKLDKVVAAMLATALVVSAVSLGLIITADYPSRTYFAVTDETGSADFNTTREINSTFSVILEMKNGEDSSCVFRVVVHNETWDIEQTFNRTLAKGDHWDQAVDIDLIYYGEVKFDFDLYITEGDRPEYFYGNLHLWLTVI